MSIESSGDIDDLGASTGPKESAEKIREKDAARKSFLAALKKKENSARKKDDRVVDILRRLLQEKGNEDMLAAIAGCLHQNIPAGFLLGVLSVHIEEAQEEFAALISSSENMLPAADNTQAISVLDTFSAAKIPPHIKAAIDAWTEALFSFGLTQPARLLATVRPSGEAVAQPLITLGAETLSKAVTARGLPVTQQNMEPFCKMLFAHILDAIEKNIADAAQLESGH